MEEWGFVDELELERLERVSDLPDLPALRLRRGPALPHLGGVEHQIASAAAVSSVQIIGSHN